MRKVYFFIFVFLTCINTIAFAGWEKPKVKFSNSYRYLIREKHSIYLERAELEFSYGRNGDKFSKVKIIPFIELRNNVQKEKMEHKEIGLEIGADVFDWLYIGESFQYTRYNYDWTNYLWHSRIKYAGEAETRLMFSFPICEIDEDRKIKAYLLDEFTYSFKLAEGTRNEAVLGLTIPIVKYIDIGLDWRHIDRIHDFDSDAIEAGLTLHF